MKKIALQLTNSLFCESKYNVVENGGEGKSISDGGKCMALGQTVSLPKKTLDDAIGSIDSQ